jgi:hypothetical protein
MTGSTHTYQEATTTVWNYTTVKPVPFCVNCAHYQGEDNCARESKISLVTGLLETKMRCASVERYQKDLDPKLQNTFPFMYRPDMCGERGVYYVPARYFLTKPEPKKWWKFFC